MNYNDVILFEERWSESQYARPEKQVRTLPLDALCLAPEVFQGRMTTISGDQQENHKRDLVKCLKNTKAHLDPVTVFWIDGSYYIIDGYHRYAAYKRCEYDLPELMADIPVNEFTGTFFEAKALSGRDNAKNKLPMNTIEKRQMAWVLLNLGKDYYGTQVNIVAITGVTENTVGKYKKLRDQYLSNGLDPKNYTLQEVLYNTREQVDYNEDWQKMQAQIKANALRKAMGPIGRSHPEVMSKALMLYLGESLAEQVFEEMAYALGIPLQITKDGEIVKNDLMPF